MSGSNPPPFELIDTQGDGLFDVARLPAPAIAPTAAELDLAKRIRRVLDAAREQLNNGIKLQDDFGDRLREVAQCGLVAPVRHPQVAGRALSGLENALRGPFMVGKMTDAGLYELRRNLASPTMSDEQRAFTAELEQHERLIRSLFSENKDDRRLEPLLYRLRHAAVMGLMDVPGDVRLAQFAALGAVHDAMRDMGQKARKIYLDRLLRSYAVTLFQAALGILVLWGLQKGWPDTLYFPTSLRVPGETLMLLTVAIAALFTGAWLSAVARLQPGSPEVLDGIYTNTFTAPLRTLFVLGFGIFALLLLYKQVVVFSFGPPNDSVFTTAAIFKTLSASILTGGFLGLGEAALPNAVIQRSSGLVSALGASTPPR